MDPQIEQLKELVRQNIALATETNSIVHGMRRAGRIKTLFWAIIFVGSIVASVGSYYLYIQPRIQQIQDFYLSVQSGDFIKQFIPGR